MNLQAIVTATNLAKLLVQVGNIPKRINDTSKRSLLSVSALTNKHQVTVVLQTTDGSNNTSKKTKQ